MDLCFVNLKKLKKFEVKKKKLTVEFLYGDVYDNVLHRYFLVNGMHTVTLTFDANYTRNEIHEDIIYVEKLLNDEIKKRSFWVEKLW